MLRLTAITHKAAEMRNHEALRPVTRINLKARTAVVGLQQHHGHLQQGRDGHLAQTHVPLLAGEVIRD